jgi:hypothetical protein
MEEAAEGDLVSMLSTTAAIDLETAGAADPGAREGGA